MLCGGNGYRSHCLSVAKQRSALPFELDPHSTACATRSTASTSLHDYIDSTLMRGSSSGSLTRSPAPAAATVCMSGTDLSTVARARVVGLGLGLLHCRLTLLASSDGLEALPVHIGVEAVGRHVLAHHGVELVGVREAACEECRVAALADVVVLALGALVAEAVDGFLCGAVAQRGEGGMKAERENGSADRRRHSGVVSGWADVCVQH